MDASRAYDRDLLMGIADFNKIHNKFTFFFSSPKYIGSENQQQLVRRVTAWNPDGILSGELDGFKSFIRLKVPLIIFPHTRLYKNQINVWGDNKGIGEMAARYLLSKGFKHFAFLGFKDFQWSLERQEGYEAVLANAGFAVNSYVYNDAVLWERLSENLLQWLDTLEKPCAIFSATDELNVHLLEAAKNLEAKVPDDFSILGVDNDVMLCEMASPPLSSIAHSARQAGFLAAQTLCKWIESGERPDSDIVIYPDAVVKRRSTNALAVEDEQMRTALHYIVNTASSEDISVDDVVNVTTLSRRILEKRFQKSINSTIMEEIKKVRIERIKFLLTNSNLTLQQIAGELNFKSLDNVTRYFKQYTGLRPLEYRAKHKER
ncbi:DNA-binding transcriptional regulator [Pedobacter nyackensis]|uniref:XylR family transcriptional regulator n=1 Tax=Pedobacter nyackensis TaxID=475255 RepID=UPI00292FD619|nr:DNA-binding transcriptional regulator [Pedobacter nyackensis]